MFSLTQVECIDLARSSDPISTGIGFLDHMLDQFNSHAQIGVAVTAQLLDDEKEVETGRDEVNRHASCDQGILQEQVGTALGEQMKKVIQAKVSEATSRFCCPLDEALVECILTAGGGNEEGELSNFQLAPYGIFPKNQGRLKIGQMETKHVETFFTAFAKSSGLGVSLIKIRGDNGHHIVESAFKAFSRALRNLLDGSTTSNVDKTNETMKSLWGKGSESYNQGLELGRTGKVQRKTKETSILVELALDGGAEQPKVETGISCLNEFFQHLVTNAQMSLEMNCQGDLWVDDHHTSEDVSIALGQVLNQAFGTKAGLNRMWCSTATDGTAKVEVTMDLSNRPCLTHNLSLSSSGEEYVEDMGSGGTSWSVEMMEHAIESLVMNALMTVHVVEHSKGTTIKETAMATAKAFGKALYFCSAVDPRRAGKTASSKGTLSV